MSDNKPFLTYNQQMRKLRNEKNVECVGSPHKTILVRSGYFNIINGYKKPFVAGIISKHHIYIKGTSITQFLALKSFDSQLRVILLKYITQIEEEVRTLAAYRFDMINDSGKIPWYDSDAYSPSISLQKKMKVISTAFNELSKSRLDYVQFYMDNHEQIPTWIMMKVINFSTFIDVLEVSKKDVVHSICDLYNIVDGNGKNDVKLLIGSLHWMRKVRNACAHNERVYCLSRTNNSGQPSGRILGQYLNSLRPSYRREHGQKIFDLVVYFKYFLPNTDFKQFIKELKSLIEDLQSKIHPTAFENVRGQMGIKHLDDLTILSNLPKDEIEYNKFDKI